MSGIRRMFGNLFMGGKKEPVQPQQPPRAAQPNRGSGGGSAGELIRQGRFETVPMFLQHGNVTDNVLRKLASSGIVVDATPAMREYLLESDANGYDWIDFNAVAPEAGKPVVLWGDAPDKARMPDGRIVSRSYLGDLPASWGALVWSRPVNPEEDRKWNVPGNAAGIVEVLVAARDSANGQLRMPVLRAFFPHSRDGKAMRFNAPAPDNMVRAMAFGSMQEQQRWGSSLMLLLNPLVLALAWRHGDVSDDGIRGPKTAVHDSSGFPLATQILKGNFQIPARRMAMAGGSEATLKRGYMSAVGSSRLIDITEGVIGGPEVDATLIEWDDLRGLSVPSAWEFVEAHPGHTSPAVRQFSQMLGMADAFGGLCRMVSVEEASQYAALPKGAARAIEVSFAVQDAPGGLIRFPVAIMFVPLDRQGRPMRLRTGDLYGGMMNSADQDMARDHERIPFWMGHISNGLLPGR